MKTQNSALAADLRKKVAQQVKEMNLGITVSPAVVEFLALQLEEKAEKAVQAVVAQHVSRRSLWAAVEAVADRPEAPSTAPSTGHATLTKAQPAVAAGVGGRLGARG